MPNNNNNSANKRKRTYSSSYGEHKHNKKNASSTEESESRRTLTHLAFRSLQTEIKGMVRIVDFKEALEKAGLGPQDPRLRDLYRELKRKGPARTALDEGEFCRLIFGHEELIHRALSGQLAIPDFVDFRDELTRIFQEVRQLPCKGNIPSDAPHLARASPNHFGVSVCTVDGQQFHLGDSDVDFCLHSGTSSLSYCMAVEELGVDFVGKYVGVEPPGEQFDDLHTGDAKSPQNPLITAGGLMCSSLIRSGDRNIDRFKTVLATYSKLAGDTTIGFNNSGYLSEHANSDRLYCLAYMLKAARSFPPGVDVAAVIDFYCQICAIECTTQRMAVIASTLANGGVCPLTAERIFQPSTVNACLSLMTSSGLLNHSPQWEFEIGLPAKSSMSGCIYLTIANLAGICVWSPPLDASNNSYRGLEFCKRLVQRFNLHKYDNLVGVITSTNTKKDPRTKKNATRQEELAFLLYAAAEGDLQEIRRLVAAGVDLNLSDYDGRTALHLASSEGQLEVVNHLIHAGVNLSPVDRWGGTPIADAYRGHHVLVAKVLESHGCTLPAPSVLLDPWRTDASKL
eukprot:GILK01013469.1.p1 GENE.GILK01013469.1~~GILK01013469.1.p1  ORF type:complete len:582 (+),score=74.12 GILK01013469.1:42-1748(+)